MPIKNLWCWDLISRVAWLGQSAFLIESLTFAWSVKKYLRKNSGEIIVYTRDLLPILFLSKRNVVIYEAHSLPANPRRSYKRLLSRASKIVVITHGLKKDLVALGFPVDKILVAPDGIDLDLFQTKNQIESRAKLHLPVDKKIVVYTGHLYAWKGADTVLEAAGKLREVVFIFVGGTEQDIKTFIKKVESKKLNNVVVKGHVNQMEIPNYLGAADILVLPNSAKVKISAEYTSPLKLFEYMAVERPIVASRLPSLQEVLNNNNAIFFTPDDPDSLIAAIREVLLNPGVAREKAERAKRDIQEYTWDKRAQTILNFI